MSHLSPATRPPAVQAATASLCRLVEWKPFDSGSLIGKATIRFAGGWIVASIPIFRRANGTLSAGTPDAPLVGPDGQQLVDDAGKKRYGKVISFEGPEARRRWNDAVLTAVTEGGITGRWSRSHER